MGHLLIVCYSPSNMEQIIRDVQDITEEMYGALIVERPELGLNKVFHSFKDKTIAPSYLTKVVSRKEVSVLQEFYDIRGSVLKIFPAFGSSMSYMTSKFARDLWEAGGIHVLPRIVDNISHQLYTIEHCERLGSFVGVSLGLNSHSKYIEKITNYKNVKFLSIDIAHGATANLLGVLNNIRSLGINSGVIVGNVGSLKGFIFVSQLMEKLGFVDYIIKVGVGPGSVCTTRVNTGVGLGQLGLLEDIYSVYSDNSSIRIISDGGVTCPGDFAKAVSRSHGVMMHRMFIGSSFDDNVISTMTDEKGNKKYRIHTYGMASSKVQGKTDYIEGGDQHHEFSSLKSAVEIVKGLDEGLRSAMTYVNAINLADFKSNVEFSINSYGAMIEGGIH